MVLVAIRYGTSATVGFDLCSEADDISPVAVFLASDAAAMITGAEYEVTAGDSAKDI
jgi:hypothetical protein